MKLKKCSYIIALILMLSIGIKGVNAESSKQCFYISSENDFRATLKITWGYSKGFLGFSQLVRTLDDYAVLSVDKTSSSNYSMNKEPLANWWAEGANNWYSQTTKGGAVKFSPYHKSENEANKDSNPSCPKYIVFQNCSTYYVWGTESEAQAQKAVQDGRNHSCTAAYATYTNANGKVITSEEYYSEFSFEGLVTLDKDGKPSCESLFGDKSDPNSLRGMFDIFLQYVRVIVPILVILIGVFDFSKAAIAAKEDTMKKAQKDFIKRVIIGVAVFFVPLLVEVVMHFADIVWQGEYTYCGF